MNHKFLPWMSGQSYKRDGFILLRFRAGWFRGDKVADGNTLSAIIGQRDFRESDYDYVLNKVSEYGYALEMELGA